MGLSDGQAWDKENGSLMSAHQIPELDGDEAFCLAKFGPLEAIKLVRERRKIGFKEAYDIVMAHNKKGS